MDRFSNNVNSFDIIGTISFSLFILILFLALLFTQQHVLPTVFLVPAMIIAALFLLVFVKVEMHTKNPLLDLRLFKVKEFSFGLAAAYFCFIILNSTMLLMATISQESPISKTIFLMCLLGTGLSIFQSPNNARVMGSVSADKLGMASSTNALFRYIGLSSGTTLSMLIFSLTSDINIGNLSAGFHVNTFLHGITAVYIFDAVCALIAMAFSMAKTKKIIET